MTSAETRSGRAAPMSPEARRSAIIDAVVPLLRRHGRTVTTRQIAEGAGIAEGTIFRVFDSKEDLVEAALTRAFDPRAFFRGLAEIDPGQPLRDRLVALVSLLQSRFIDIFTLMNAVGLVAPPDHDPEEPAVIEARARIRTVLLGLVEPDAAALRISTDLLLHVLRLLTFSGSHTHISDHHLLTPDEIVDVVLNGALIHPKD
ncbi:MAG: TetR/AcrR family transcriptional regulator [Nocardioidaceae bacterium]